MVPLIITNSKHYYLYDEMGKYCQCSYAIIFSYYLDFILTKRTLLKQSYTESNNTTQTDKVHMKTKSAAALKTVLMNTNSKISRYSKTATMCRNGHLD